MIFVCGNQNGIGVSQRYVLNGFYHNFSLLGPTLGEGEFGSVLQGIWLTPDGTEVLLFPTRLIWFPCLALSLSFSHFGVFGTHAFVCSKFEDRDLWSVSARLTGK